MLTAIKNSGAAFKAMKLAESLEQSLSDEQKAMIGELSTIARGMAGSLLPENVQPIANYVLQNTGEPFIAKVMGAAFHPEVKQSLIEMLPHSDRIMPDEGISVRCRNCNFVAQYGAVDNQHM